MWRDLTHASELGQETLAFTHRRPVPQNRDHVYSIKGVAPVLDSDGLLLYSNRFDFSVRFSEKSSEAMRSRLRNMAVYAFADTDTTTPIGYSMRKAQGIW